MADWLAQLAGYRHWRPPARNFAQNPREGGKKGRFAREIVENPRERDEKGRLARKIAKIPRERHIGRCRSRGSLTEYRFRDYLRNLMQHQLSMES